MDLGFTPEQQMLRKSVSEFIAKECPFETVKEIEDSPDGYVAAMWKKMARLGWMELIIPEAYGGLADPFSNLLILLEEMGKKAFVSPYMSTVVMCGLILMDAASEAQKKKLLPKIAKGKLIIALAQHEGMAGYTEACVTMPATADGDGYLLNGTKMFVMDANIADMMIVASRIETFGTTLFLVDAAAPGILIEKMPTIGKDNACEVVFDKVTVSKKDMIGSPGLGWDILRAMEVKATIAKSAEMMGGCKAAMDMAAAYSKHREQYGTPIGGFQALQHYMANMKTAYDTSYNFLYEAAWMIDQGMDASLAASVLKAQINEKYKFITERAVQIHGGVGTTREFDIGLFYRRAKASEFMLGDTPYHQERIAAAII